jgi:hypothetical protein
MIKAPNQEKGGIIIRKPLIPKSTQLEGDHDDPATTGSCSIPPKAKKK